MTTTSEGARTALLVTLLTLLSGCAAMSETEREYRDYRRADFENRFIEARTLCHARGGRMLINARQTLGRDGIPNPGDFYVCG
ncbi:MAG: hypothetical protein QNJ00_12865 [Woeseiaceae bacterium]|nr:hypothetical protein [Woeseiaceae bacterium]